MEKNGKESANADAHMNREEERGGKRVNLNMHDDAHDEDGGIGPHSRNVADAERIPSKTRVFCNGTYWQVISLMASCEAIPPINAATVCNSPPPD